MPKKILLADDSITIQKVVELTFSDGDYEVTAVNNGAKAVQKLGEMRPDIILSDIIMPEKNGYEVCEYVKSHPEYRNIPVVLLTGTFEPFDPDRADKAGCDAVVTKPFESQSLIHKVEELIEQSRASAPAAAPAAEPAQEGAQESASPWAGETPAAEGAFTPEDNLFAPAAPATGPTTEMPFPRQSEEREPAAASPAPEDAGATTQQFTPPTGQGEPSPWDEGATAGETRAFPAASFDDLQKMGGDAEQPGVTEANVGADESPFGAPPPAEEFSGETRAFPKMNFDDLQKMADQAPAQEPEPPAAEESPWGAGQAGGETRAFPQMSFEQLSNAASQDAASEQSTWGEPSEGEAPAWSSTPEPPPAEEPQPATFGAPEPMSFDATSEPAESEAEAPAWSAPSEPPPAASAGNGLDLTDDQIDRIARRVVQLMSDQVVRNIAWEVIPDMAEMVVKERIRQLESEG